MYPLCPLRQPTLSSAPPHRQMRGIMTTDVRLHSETCRACGEVRPTPSLDLLDRAWAGWQRFLGSIEEPADE